MALSLWACSRCLLVSLAAVFRGSQATKELREQAKDLEFVQKRWHLLNTNIIAKRYPDWICILEPHKDGVWHR
jgi:hypothetical protein